MPPRIVLATLGSLGDLHPFIAVGLALREHGVSVVVGGAAEFASKVERAGLEFRCARPSFADFERDLGMDLAQLTRAALARPDFLLRRLIGPNLRRSYDDFCGILGGADLLLASSLAVGARLAAEKQGVPWIGVVLQPFMFMSRFDPPELPNAPGLAALLRRLGPVPTRGVLGVARALLGRQLNAAHALRADVGLAATRANPLFAGQFGPAGALGLYSPLLGGVRADYPVPTTLTGFAIYDSADGGPVGLDAGLERFLDAGPAPLVFTLGSLIVLSPGRFFRDSAAAARRLGLRAVLLVGENGLGECAALACGDVFVAGYAPHSRVFARAAVIVHQGGIGTLAQALRAGRPQLIVPFYGDQSDNAARARRLGVARILAPDRYGAASAAREIAIASLPEYAARAAAVGAVLARENGAAAAAAAVMDRLESRRRS